MSVEGLWCFLSASVEAPTVFEAGGVVVLETGRVLGGDSVYAYVGDYTVDRGAIEARVRVYQWNLAVEAENVFGMTGPVDYMARLQGQREGDWIIGQINPEAAPHLQLPIQMRFIQALP